MGNIIQTKKVNLIRSAQPDPLLSAQGKPVEEVKGDGLYMGYSSAGAVYNPNNSYPLIVKGCPDVVHAPTNPYPGPCPPPPWTNSGWYNNFPPGYSFCSHCWPAGAYWYGHPDCNCCQSITGGGSNSKLANNSENAKILRGELNPPDFTDKKAYPSGDPEQFLYGKAKGPGVGTICHLYSAADVWYRYIEDSSGTVINPNNPIPDCYPTTHPGMGCPIQVGQCFRWNTGDPTCVVERLLDYPTGQAKIFRNNFYCSTCDDPVTPPYIPNDFADHELPYYGPVTPGFPGPPDPWPVTSNPTGTMCTDCSDVWNGNFHCLHPDDPIYNMPSTCIELSAGTVVHIANPGPNQTYGAINGTNVYQLANTTIQGTLMGCELTCIGGCTQQFSGVTAACNYSPAAAFDDGSCCFNFPCLGCGDPTAINYCPNCCTYNPLLCLYPGEGCIDDSVGLFLDITGGTSCGPLSNQPCQYCNYDPAAYIPKPCCDVSGCMDGTCATGVGGFPSLTGFYDCGPMNNMGYLYANYDPTACCEGLCCTDVGCTDPVALNYDPLACADDGSCLYPLGGCMDDGSAANAPTYRPVGWAGAACNWNNLVTFDDGSCLYGGCQISNATNYEPLATADCSCDPVGTNTNCCSFDFGCLDDGLQPNSTFPGTSAYNFDPLAQGCNNGNNIPNPTLYDCCLYPTFECNIGANMHQQVQGLDSVGCGYSNRTFIPPETFTPETPYGVTWVGAAVGWIAANHPTVPWSQFYYLDYWNTGPGYGGTQSMVPGTTCMSAVTHNHPIPAVPGSIQMPCPSPAGGGPPAPTCLKFFATPMFLAFDNSQTQTSASNSLYTWSAPPLNTLLQSTTNYPPQSPATLNANWNVNIATQTWEDIIIHCCQRFQQFWDIGNTLYRADAGGCLACPAGTPLINNIGCQPDPTCGQLAQTCPASVWSNSGPCQQPKCCCKNDGAGGCIPGSVTSLIMSTNPCECPPNKLEVSCTPPYPIISNMFGCPFAIHQTPKEVLCIMAATDPNWMDSTAYMAYQNQYGTPPPGRWRTPGHWLTLRTHCDCITWFDPIICASQNNQLGEPTLQECVDNCYAGCLDPLANNYDPLSPIPCGPQDGSGLWMQDNDCCTYDPTFTCYISTTSGVASCYQHPYGLGPFPTMADCQDCYPICCQAPPVVGPSPSLMIAPPKSNKQLCSEETNITIERSKSGGEEYHLWKSCPPAGITGQVMRMSIPLCAADTTCAALMAANGGVINGGTPGLLISATNLYYNHAVSQLGPINPGDVIKCYPNCCGECFEYLGIAWHYAGTSTPNIPTWVGKTNSCEKCDRLPDIPHEPIYCKKCNAGYPVGQQTQGLPCNSLGPGWIPQSQPFNPPCIPHDEPTDKKTCKKCNNGYPVGNQVPAGVPCSFLGQGWIPQSQPFVPPCAPNHERHELNGLNELPIQYNTVKFKTDDIDNGFIKAQRMGFKGTKEMILVALPQLQKVWKEYGGPPINTGKWMSCPKCCPGGSDCFGLCGGGACIGYAMDDGPTGRCDIVIKIPI